ncbi:uncharacterized protein LOC144908161 [Branchiostoma floridae x Branchiostoma belcheri]
MSLATREPTDTSIGGWRPGQPSPRRRRNASLLESNSADPHGPRFEPQLGHVVEGFLSSVISDECPKPGYDHFTDNGVCYKSFAEEKTYDEAKQTCAEDGGMLAMPKDEATNTFIYGLGYGDVDRWIGLSDAASEDNWVFEDGQTLESTGYNNWDQGEPQGGEAENCVVLRSENPTTWNDLGCNDNKRFICQLYQGLKPPKNCADLYLLGARVSGTYHVGYPQSFQVYCDMGTDGGGWTAVQRRQDGSVAFNRTWDEYVRGFGHVGGEFWLGLDHLHKLIAPQHHELYVYLEDWEGNSAFAKYSEFSVGNAERKYTATIGGYSGNATDSMTDTGVNGRRNMNNQKFSTRDQDNDLNANGGNCAATYGQGGWWYPNSCGLAFLNGQYLTGCNSDCEHAEGVVWETWKSYRYSLKKTAMMIRPADFTQCPKQGYVRFNHNGVCYKYYNEQKRYNEAKQTCAADGGMLAMPKDNATNTFIFSLGDRQCCSWIGLSDAVSEGNWVFEDGQTLASTGYSNWRQGEPNLGVIENCAALRYNAESTWVDLRCRSSLKFTCQLYQVPA